MRTGTGKQLIGKTIRIMNRKDKYYGEWATIVSFNDDGDYALYGATLHAYPSVTAELARSEFWVMRGQREGA